MKATVERATLVKCLGHIQSVVERRNTIPILSNVLIEARGDGLRLMATDLDLQVVETIPAGIDVQGATTVSAHTLFDIVRKIPDGAQVELAVSGDRMSVVAGRSRFSLSTLKRDDFPVIAETDLPVRFTLSAADLKELIDATRFAISTEETRYYLNGIYMHATSGPSPKLRGVATDGHRLARIELELPAGAADMPGVIVPRKCVAEVRKLLDEMAADAPVEISLSAAKIRFRFSADSTLTSKLIDGTFPDYSRVIPTANDKLLKIDAKTLAEGVDRVAAIATTEKTRAVKLALGRDKVTLSVTSPENGTASEDLAADYAASELEVGFNYRYLLDILGQVRSDSVDVHLSDASAPTLIREGDDARALYVLMPMRV
ncbi:DNA polymerase III subunit beta [Sandarakinorhabdus cyanobacteriorum]|uniref:Beta sliding clamp n=1 Tax=Sandarakinorhabdus cyanobacteriorum TaxID=1981098 RepID=A0A255YLM0_9SPHN|nr:DNA polymerase III subunit beta [Sandarakinorhabdus cyanobacteriorum]OYQ30091.1 DNA polymerase III subunit beta [Sandarakinorhabdus cyanobacteriorum]